MHRHRELCSGAVDPLEIAAGLEAQGVTDGVAGRFRHRDVFSLAEELYVRVPRGEGSQPVQRAQQPQRLARRRAALHLLPGVVCAGAALAGPALRAEPLHVLVVAVVAPALVVAATVAALRHGPLRAKGSAPTGSPPTGGALWTCWLLGFALYGERAVGSRLASGALAALTALAFALGPAAWCARRFAVRAGARLAQSRSLADFASDVRPLLAGALALFLLAELALLCAAFAVSGVPVTAMALAGPAALGVLLFTARLLAVHGFPGPAAAGPGGACAIEALALAAALLHPLFPLVRVPDPAIVPVLACAAAAVALTAYAFRALARASAHLMPLTEAVPR
jgi:hypothetical protein